MWRSCLVWLVLVSCGSETPGAPVPREGRLAGDQPSVLILVADAAQASELDRQGHLGPDSLVAKGTRMAAAFGRFDELGAVRADLLGAEDGLPGTGGGGDLRARFVAAGYRTPEVGPADLAPLWTGASPAFAVVELGSEAPLDVAAGLVASIHTAGHAADVLWVALSWTGDPAAQPISEERLAVPMVLGLEGRLDAGEARPQVVCHADLGATLLDLCGLGLTPGPGAEGASFARILIKQPHAWRGHVLARRLKPVEGEPRAWVRGLKWRLVIGGPEGERLTWVEEDRYSKADDRGRPGATLAYDEMLRLLAEWE